MSLSATMRVKIAIVCAALFALVGCEQLREMTPKLNSGVITAGSSSEAHAGNVIPTRGLRGHYVIQVEKERSLTYIAREVGVTVAELIAGNKLTTTALHEGQELHVNAIPTDVSRFVAKREARKARKIMDAKKAIADAEAKKLADIKAREAAKKAKAKKAARAAAVSKRAASRRARKRRSAAKRAVTKRAKAAATRRARRKRN